MTKNKRLSRARRSEHPPNMRLTERDVEILKVVAAYRILRQDHIQQLFFGSKSTAQYRLSHLYQHGFLQRHFLPVYAGWSPTLYTLDKRGIAVLRHECKLERVQVWDSENGHEFLSHTLAINDVRVAITLACRDANYTLVQWISEVALKAEYDRVTITNEKGKQQSISLIPDSYFTIETPQGKSSCFLEMDMGTMTVTRFATKIRAYLAYTQSGEYQKRYQTKSLRVLTITTSQTRCINLRAAAESVGGDRRFWFSRKEQTVRETVLHSPIWQAIGNSAPLALVPR